MNRRTGPADREITFAYRLPLTYVRVTGTRTTTNSLDNRREITRKSVITTESGADLLTRIPVRMSLKDMATQKSTWTLMADGRLTGSEVTTAVESGAAWKAAFEVGAGVLGAVGVPLLGAGPPGWIALAAVAGTAAVGTGLFVHGNRTLTGEFYGAAYKCERPEVPDADPADWDVHALYVEEEPSAAVSLASYRATLTAAANEHAHALYASMAPNADLAECQSRADLLHRILVSASAGARQAEAIYAQWRLTKSTVTTTDVDERLRIDDFPTREALKLWASGPTGSAAWASLVDTLAVAVSVDLEPIPGDNGKEPRLDFEPTSSGDVVHYRQPRPAVLRTWKVMPAESNSYTLELAERRNVFVAYPGNEAELNVSLSDDTSSAASATFDEAGALTKVTSETIDRALQRARDVSALMPAIASAAESGSKLRDLLSPPSLVDRAAEAKAATELGLTESPSDPLKPLRDQLEEERLRAALRLSRQLATSNSPPVIVSFSEVLEG